MSEMLRVDDLRVVYRTYNRTTYALKGISMTMQSGDVVGIVGEGGSGKSTFVNAIVDLLPVQATAEGFVRVLGRDLRTLSFKDQQVMRRRDLGVILAGGRARLNPMARVGDQIANVLRSDGKAKSDASARAVELLAEVGIPDPSRRARAYPHELSGGMAQRIVIAMALAARPKFIICDEPTAGLDVTIATEVFDLIGRLIDEVGAGALIVTRDLGIVAERCTRVAVLEAGALAEDTSVRSFFASPSSAHGQALLEAARLDGTKERRARDREEHALR